MKSELVKNESVNWTSEFEKEYHQNSVFKNIFPGKCKYF